MKWFGKRKSALLKEEDVVVTPETEVVTTELNQRNEKNDEVEYMMNNTNNEHVDEIIIENPEAVETDEKDGVQIDKGIVLFHQEDGSVHYQLIGPVTLENITYYRRFLDQIEEGFWAAQAKGE